MALLTSIIVAILIVGGAMLPALTNTLEDSDWVDLGNSYMKCCPYQWLAYLHNEQVK